jgi:tetratricopeptide (TPR) repeat protein
MIGHRSAPRFSIVVVARDEMEALPDLLYDLEDFIDRGGDLLLVDTGSTDVTIDIARRNGCRVEAVGDRFDARLDASAAVEIERRFAQPGEGPLVEPGQRLFHFGDARQHAGELAAHPFVLQLDASDTLPALDIDALDRWIEAGEVRAFAYEQQYGNVRLRISRFYERSCYRWLGQVHEVLDSTGAVELPPTSTIRCDPAQLLVHHRKGEQKVRNYLAGLALQVLESPEKPRWWHYLGRELFYQHHYRSAIAVLDAHVAMTNTWPAERSQSLCFVGECLEALEQWTEATDTYRRAFSLDATRREPLLRLAALCCRHAEFETAVAAAREALTIPCTSAFPEPAANYTWIPHSILYWSLFWLGRKSEARVHWETYLSLATGTSLTLTKDHARLFPPVDARADKPL